MKKERKTLASDYIYAMLRVALGQKEERKEQREKTRIALMKFVFL